MKKILVFAIVALCALFAFSSCGEKAETVIGDRTVPCTPQNLTIKEGSSATFTFTSPYDELVWQTIGSLKTDEPEAEIQFTYEGNNTIRVYGIKAGKKIIFCYDPASGTSIAHTIRGGVNVTVTQN